MRVTCERCLRRYDVPDATVKGRKIRARCKCGARVVVQDEERAARSSAGGSQTTGSIQRPVRWFVDITSWEPIAMDLRQLVRAFDGGRIDADTLVWRKGMPDWRRLRDVAELAERLMGAEAAKAATPEPAFEPLRTESEPSPRVPEKQPERSRTPPANYNVSTTQARGSVPPAEHIPVPAGVSGSDQKSSDQEEVIVPTLPGGSMATLPSGSVQMLSGGSVPATPAGGYSSPAPPRTSARPERRSVPSPSPAPLAGRGLLPSDQPRTITQTGLAPAPDPAHRLVQAAAGADAPITEEPEATRNGAAAVAVRASRTAAAGGRRVPSSDETPAQKPSSISVPSGTHTPAPSRIRTKHLVALGGLVVGLVLIVGGTLSSEPAPSTPAINSSPEPGTVAPVALPEPPHVENRNALVPDPAPTQPVKAEPAPGPTLNPLPVPAPASNRPAVAEASTPTTAATTLPVRPPRPVAPSAPARSEASAKAAAEAPVLDIRPSEPTPIAASNLPAPVTGRGELGAPATPPPPSAQPAVSPPVAPPPVAPPPVTPPPVTPPPTATAPSATAPSVAAAPPVAPAPPPAAAAPPAAANPPAAVPSQPAAPPAAGAPAPPAPPAAPVAPFDVQRANVQLGLAAFKASTCGPLGDTRGAGAVTVVFESFGRVTRVTHSNPAFVGNPVGNCVTQAYQQAQIAPFSGGPQTLTSSFVVP